MSSQTTIYVALIVFNILLLFFMFHCGFYSTNDVVLQNSLQNLHNTIKIIDEAKPTAEYIQHLIDNPQVQSKSVDRLLNHVNSLLLTMTTAFEKCKVELDLKKQTIEDLANKVESMQSVIYLEKNSTTENLTKNLKIANELKKMNMKLDLQKEKRVISFSLYGNKPRYLVGALRNLELSKFIFPNWICRFYVDNSVPKATIDALKENGAEIIEVKNLEGLSGGTAGMFWRFFVADDESVDRYIIRDVDSRLNMREKAAIDEWIESGKKIHTLRDHPNHNFAFNGGMWGGVKGAIKNMRGKIADWKQKKSVKQYIDDMNFLNNIIYPEIKGDILSHDSFYCQRYPNSRSFPTPRIGHEHVGQVFDENDIPREGDLKFFHGRQSPMACRRRPDWKLG